MMTALAPPFPLRPGWDVVTTHECGFASKPTSAGLAAAALRNHSCARYERRAASRARGAAAAAAIDRTPMPCWHKEAEHQHGTHAKYVLDKCRCLPCAKANSDYESNRVRQSAYGRWQPYVDAAPAREHVRALMAAGVGLKQINKTSGVSHGCLWKLIYGKKNADGSQRPTTKLRQNTVDRLLAVRPSHLADGARIDATGTRRRVQALVTIGWSQSKLAARLGMLPGNFNKTFTGDRVVVSTARAVTELYDELWDQTPPRATHRDKIAYSRSVNFARARDWLPPLAWDETSIDDPDASPATDVVEDEAGLDEIAIDRFMAGTLRNDDFHLPPELIEAVRRLSASGRSDRRIGEVVGLSGAAVLKIRIRNDIEKERTA